MNDSQHKCIKSNVQDKSSSEIQTLNLMKLPVEILTMIAEYVCQYNIKNMFMLSHVCQLWYDIAYMIFQPLIEKSLWQAVKHTNKSELILIKHFMLSLHDCGTVEHFKFNVWIIYPDMFKISYTQLRE